MRDAEELARRSYQRGLGVGFTSSPQMRQRLEFEAAKGWLRGYVLYFEEKACAFWIGSLYQGTFYSDFIGYDADYAKFSPGLYLVINALEELSDPTTKNPIGFGSRRRRRRMEGEPRGSRLA